MTATWFAACVVLAAAACGPKPAPAPPQGDPDPTAMKPPPALHDSRTPLEQRRDAACEALGPRITKCAVEDAQVAAVQGTITQKQLADISAPEVLAKNSALFADKCKTPMSSRQVRVLEVCPRAETQCQPLLDCLAHLHEPAN